MNTVAIIMTDPEKHQQAINDNIDRHEEKHFKLLSAQTNIQPSGYIGHNTYRPTTTLITTLLYRKN